MSNRDAFAGLKFVVGFRGIFCDTSTIHVLSELDLIASVA